MYMGMEVQFDFKVHPAAEFTQRICQQVEANIESSRREERVQRKRRELRERIKVQIVQSPYTMSPKTSIIDSNRRDSMALPLERGSFTPFQKVPFRSEFEEADRRNASLFKPYSYNNFGQPKSDSTISSDDPTDGNKSVTAKEWPTALSESLSSHSSFSLICSPPRPSLSPTLGSLAKVLLAPVRIRIGGRVLLRTNPNIFL